MTWWMVSTIVTQKAGHGFKPVRQPGPYCAEFARPPRARMGFATGAPISPHNSKTSGLGQLAIP